MGATFVAGLIRDRGEEAVMAGTKVGAIEVALKRYGAECSRGNECDNRERIKEADDAVWKAIWAAIKVVADRRATHTKGVTR
jgi:hypothetical protein